MGAYGDVNVLGHGRESPYGELTTQQVDIVDRLNCSSASSLPNLRPEHRSPQGGNYGRTQHDVTEVMMFWAVVSGGNFGPAFVILNLTIKEVQTDAVGSVLTTLLGVKVVERAPIVLVDVPVLHEHAFSGVGDLRLETLRDSCRIELRV